MRPRLDGKSATRRRMATTSASANRRGDTDESTSGTTGKHRPIALAGIVVGIDRALDSGGKPASLDVVSMCRQALFEGHTPVFGDSFEFAECGPRVLGVDVVGRNRRHASQIVHAAVEHLADGREIWRHLDRDLFGK